MFETILVIINLLIFYLVYSLKETVKAQKGTIESFKSQTEFLQNLHSTISEIYDPSIIKNILAMEKKKLEGSFEDEIEGYQLELEQLLSEKEELKNKIKEFKEEKDEDGEQINLFGHNMLVTIFAYHINLLQLIINTRKGLTIYAFVYEKEFKGVKPDPISLDLKLSKIEKKIELKFELLGLDELRNTDLGVHNDLYPKLVEYDYDKLGEDVLEIRRVFTEYLDKYFLGKEE